MIPRTDIQCETTRFALNIKLFYILDVSVVSVSVGNLKELNHF